MFKNTTKTSPPADLDGLALIFQRVSACYTPRANDLERHDALHIHFRNISEMLRLLEAGRTDGRRATDSGAASALMTLAYSAMRRDPEGLLPIETLDRPAILLAICNVILSCITVAEALELDLPAALAQCSRHLAPSGTYESTHNSTVRRVTIRLSDGKRSLADLV